MSRTPMFLAALFATSAPLSSQDSLRLDVAEDDVLIAAPQHADHVRWVASRVVWLDSLFGSDAGKFLRYARLGSEEAETNTIVPVTTPSFRGASTRYDVLMDLDGGVLAVRETPVSFTGEWDNHYIHYFDAQGRTIALRRHSTILVGCGFQSSVESRPTPAQEESLYMFAGGGILVAKDYALGSLDGGRVDIATCQFEYRFDYGIFADWATYARANGLPRT